jgi:hypothetical protein
VTSPVRGLVYPAALLARFRPDLTGGLSEPERAIGDGEPWRHVEPAPLQVEQQIEPVLRAFAGVISEADQVLAAFRRFADQHQDALLFVFEACLEMDAIGPGVNVALRRQIAPLPRGVVVKLTVLQPADCECRQLGSILAELRRQSLGEVAVGDTLQVKDRAEPWPMRYLRLRILGCCDVRSVVKPAVPNGCLQGQVQCDDLVVQGAARRRRDRCFLVRRRFGPIALFHRRFGRQLIGW